MYSPTSSRSSESCPGLRPPPPRGRRKLKSRLLQYACEIRSTSIVATRSPGVTWTLQPSPGVTRSGMVRWYVYSTYTYTSSQSAVTFRDSTKGRQDEQHLALDRSNLKPVPAWLHDPEGLRACAEITSVPQVPPAG
jgi:hypothetical protein